MDREIFLINLVLQSEAPLRLRELTTLADLPKATVHRILQKLCRYALLIRHKELYYIGPTLLRWMNATHYHRAYIDIIHPHLLALSEKTGHTIHLVQREDNYAYYIDKIDSKGSVSAKSKIGDRLHLYSTGAGRAILSLFSEKELERYFQEIPLQVLTRHTQIDPESIRKEVELCKKQGFAVEIEQNEPNIQCIGVSFSYHNMELAISITLTTLNSKEELLALSEYLLLEKERIQKILI